MERTNIKNLYPLFTHLSIEKVKDAIDKIVSDEREARILKEKLGIEWGRRKW